MKIKSLYSFLILLIFSFISIATSESDKSDEVSSEVSSDDGIEGTNPDSSQETGSDSIKVTNSENTNTFTPFTFDQAMTFMQSRCLDINQELVDAMEVNFDGQPLYVFLTAEPSYTYLCVSSVSQWKLDVMASDCGRYQEKMDQWLVTKSLQDN